MDIREALGHVVRRRREDLGLTLHQVVAAVKASGGQIDRWYLSQVESGQRNVGIRKLDELARGLGTRGSELLREAEDVVVDADRARGRTGRNRPSTNPSRSA